MRPRGRGVVLVVIAALLAPTLADADDLGGLTAGSITVDSPGDLPVVPTIIMADCFCTPSFIFLFNTISGRRPERIGSERWATSGIWSITGERLRPPTATTADRLALYNARRADVAVEADFVRSNATLTFGLVARSNGEITGSATMRRLQIVVASGRAVLTGWVGTTVTTIADVDASWLSATYRLRMEVVGSRVRVSVGATVLIDQTLPSPLDGELAAGTHVGAVATGASTERLDDILVTAWPP